MKSLNTVNLAEIKEVWESFSGWYWFVTEYHEEMIAFGLVRGWETEWGYFDLAELRELAAQSKVWQVPRDHWAFCPCVETDAVSCSGKSDRVTPGWRPWERTIERRWLEHGRRIQQQGHGNLGSDESGTRVQGRGG